MPEIEKSKDKNPDEKKTHLTPPESGKTSSKETPKANSTSTPQKSVWDLPDGEFSEVIDSEGHRNRINYY
ncbi:hypothetical protein D3C87_1251720 [compost metagenome]